MTLVPEPPATRAPSVPRSRAVPDTMLSNAGHLVPNHAHQLQPPPQLKPSPLAASSADNNAPRSLHLHPVQAVNSNYNNTSSTNLAPHNHHYYTSNLSSTNSSTSSIPNTAFSTSPAYTHATASASSLASTSTSTTTSTLLHHKLRRTPGGANLAEYRQQHLHQQQQQQQQARTGANPHHRNGGGGGATSSASAAVSTSLPTSFTPAGMSSINAIAAAPAPAGGGPPHGHPQGRFDGPRSPPNTAHVPCKFFRQGACQAGTACPFSHDIGAAAENVCKYFAKGNCKFGPKCANIHVLPDGRRVNYGKNGVTVTPINFGNRLNPMAYGHSSSNSALTNSFMRAEAVPPYTSYANATDDRYSRQAGLENGLPTIDTPYSGPASPYGSPHGGDDARMGFGLSPGIPKGLSVLDAPLPASFDSNGISHAARYGPWPASVPNKFGLESPSPSLHSTTKDTRTSDTLKMLHTSAFGSSEHLSPSHLGGDVENMGSSPPQQPIGEEFFGRRIMHSSSNKYSKPRLLSSSAPKVDRDWDDNFLFLEEDYVPGELANDLLTPAEKARRGSVRVLDNNINEQTASGENSTKYGSPIGASSPSRWNTLFERQQKDDHPSGTPSGGGALAKSLKGASAFGHVGSPLRNSSLASGLDLNGGSGRPSLAGSRTGSTAESLSALTQQLQRTRLLQHEESGGGGTLHPSSARAKDTRALERHISSGSIGSSSATRFTTPIDEEEASFVFTMEEDDELREKGSIRKAGGGGMGMGGSASASGGGGWSYANVASKTGGDASSGGDGGSGKGSAAVETR